MHTQSEEAKEQIATEIQIEENMKAVMAKLEAETEKGEEVEDAAALRNQFNFSERACQTSNQIMKDQEVMTVPPVTLECSGCVTQWEIFDSYNKDLLDQQRAKEREAARKGKKKKGKGEKEEKKAPKTKVTNENIIYSPSMQLSLKLVERAVNQNACGAGFRQRNGAGGGGGILANERQ